MSYRGNTFEDFMHDVALIVLAKESTETLDAAVKAVNSYSAFLRGETPMTEFHDSMMALYHKLDDLKDVVT